jgi:hypothetical protein
VLAVVEEEVIGVVGLVPPHVQRSLHGLSAIPEVIRCRDSERARSEPRLSSKGLVGTYREVMAG